MSFNAYSAYTCSSTASDADGPIGHLLLSVGSGDSGSSFTGSYGPFYEPGTYTWFQNNTGWTSTYNMIAFSASVTGSDVSYGASYMTTNGTGLTDGDYVGVTSYSTTVGSFTEGTQGYQMSDTDGIMMMNTSTVSAVDSVSLDLFVQSTSWEGLGLHHHKLRRNYHNRPSGHTRSGHRPRLPDLRRCMDNGFRSCLRRRIPVSGILIQRSHRIDLLGQHNVLLGWPRPRPR